jgi:hypothetical protein
VAVLYNGGNEFMSGYVSLDRFTYTMIAANRAFGDKMISAIDPDTEVASKAHIRKRPSQQHLARKDDVKDRN